MGKYVIVRVGPLLPGDSCRIHWRSGRSAELAYDLGPGPSWIVMDDEAEIFAAFSTFEKAIEWMDRDACRQAQKELQRLRVQLKERDEAWAKVRDLLEGLPEGTEGP